MVLDRTQSPEYRRIEHIDLVKAEEKQLSNNIPVYVVNAGTQDLLKIEFIFEAGVWQQNYPLVAYASNQMLDEGTKQRSAEKIAESIDYYGAFLETEISMDYAYVSLYVLSKHLKSVLPLVEDIIKNPVFPVNEFRTFVQNKKQHLLVEEQKVEPIARKKFKELLFGEKHPYGHSITSADYDNLKTGDLADFHRKFYCAENCKIIIAGKVSQGAIDSINGHFGGKDWQLNSKKGPATRVIQPVSGAQKQLIAKKDAVQSALRIGKLMFNKTHPDYLPMQVLNTVLGGYFGSRLMANIREDKGYTYGIGSSIVSLKNGGYFSIASEVGVDVCSRAVDEIFFEIKRLREETIPPEELELVKSYMLGIFLRSIDGPFALADKFKGIMEYGLGYDYYENQINTIKNISAKELKDLANTYFREDSMTELVVGAKG